MNSLVPPLVSVIVPIFNGELDLPDLLACLESQTYPHRQTEYLLVDNGSHDRTGRLLEEAQQTAVLPLQCLQENRIQSSYAARNTGIRAATGEILVFTDVDCRPQPDWLSHLIDPFSNPAIGVVAGEITALPGSSIWERYAERHQVLSQKHTLAHAYRPYGQTANLAIRRLALDQAGLFRPYLTTGGDADLCWRIQHQNWQIYFAEAAIVQHRHRSTLSDLRQQWQRYGRSNRYLHDLYGIHLMRELTQMDYLYRWSRWLLKELPIAAIRILTGRMAFSCLLDTPIDLLCTHARAVGQRSSRLPEHGAWVEWLSQPYGTTVSEELSLE